MTPHLYQGTKRVYAHPMTRGEYNAYRGWEVPADENPADAGYLVEYTDGGKSNHPAHAGYISWSPEDVFCRAYSLVPGSDLPPHQQRVLDEKAELDERLAKLDAFILDNPTFLTLPDDERYHLQQQSELMSKLSAILDARIANF